MSNIKRTTWVTDEDGNAVQIEDIREVPESDAKKGAVGVRKSKRSDASPSTYKLFVDKSVD